MGMIKVLSVSPLAKFEDAAGSDVVDPRGGEAVSGEAVGGGVID